MVSRLQMLLYNYIAVHIKQYVKKEGSLSKAGISHRVSFFQAAMRDEPVFPFIFQIQNICNNTVDHRTVFFKSEAATTVRPKIMSCFTQHLKITQKSIQFITNTFLLTHV